MSVKVSDAVWKHSRAKRGTKLVLLAIANHAHDDATGAWPGQALLAAETGLNERSVRFCLDKLVGLGELLIEPPKPEDGHRSHNYTVLVHRPEVTAASEPEDATSPPALTAASDRQVLPTERHLLTGDRKSLPTNRHLTDLQSSSESSSLEETAQAQPKRTNEDDTRSPRRASSGYVAALRRKYPELDEDTIQVMAGMA
jgi:hypothetical protein